ncbi:MAG: SH3 domain-containing protein [Candidatus Omnitrophica bacterium]|nr:SH3 domain-containing protein [Candidatus Omnitrophota bacterium]
MSNVVSAEEQFPFVAEAVSDNTHIRAGQSSDFESLYQANHNTQFVVVGKLYSWYKVELPADAVSFIAVKYVLPGADNKEGLVLGDKVNVRAKADINGTAVGKVVKGDTISIIEKKDEWYKIRSVPNSFGWVKIDSVKFVNQDVESFKQSVQLALIKPTQEVIPAFCPIPAKSNSAPEQINKLSFIGILEPVKDISLENVKYQVTDNGQVACYIFGLNELLPKFANFTVKVEGTAMEKYTASAPVLELDTIKLQL